MQTGPKVSVVVPTYNYAHFLDETIQSVLAQTYTDFELIIVDNCSTDNSAEVIQKYLSDSRVSLVVNERNLGLVGNWNKCLEVARGEYIKFLCADDKFFPQILEKFVPVLDQHPDVAIVTSYSEQFGTRSFCKISPFKGKVSRFVVRQDLLGPNNRLRNPTCIMFRKKDADKLGLFNPKMWKLTDREYYLRLLSVGDCYVIPELLSYVRSHGSRVSAQARNQKAKLIIEYYHFIYSVLKNATKETDPDYRQIKERVRKSAIRCAALVLELLPGAYKKENRALLKAAYEIAASEKVVLAPLSHYLKLDYIKKLTGKEPKAKVAA